MKEELGPGHFEGRSWTGLHRPALMAMIAFLQRRRLKAGGEKRTDYGAPQPTLPAVRRAIPTTAPVLDPGQGRTKTDRMLSTRQGAGLASARLANFIRVFKSPWHGRKKTVVFRPKPSSYWRAFESSVSIPS